MSATNAAANPVDILIGARPISAVLGVDVRSLYYLNSIGAVPTWRCGRRLAASRAALEQWVADNATRARAEHEARHRSALEPTP